MATANGVVANGAPVASDEMLVALQQRLIASGQWAIILRTLQRRLNETGWTDDLRSFARDKAAARDGVSLAQLVTEITPQARTTVPMDVKTELGRLVREWVEANVE